MSNIIKLLPDSVANQIAAGEVIQRPASVVKELMENAVDAGSTSIQVIVSEAGRSLIQIIDNGYGMSEMDARMAFERHATSKIDRAEDLFAIRTKGFRGEALASIAAVAQVELKTRQRDSELGTHISIAGSKLESQDLISCPEGSNFIVRNLFFNIPARRKFLKKNSTEFRHIINEFERVALAHPDIEFSLSHNNSAVLTLPKGNQRQRIVAIAGKQFNNSLVPIQVETELIKLTGFIGKPESARKTMGDQFFFVNNRFIRHPYLHKAITEGYDNLISPDSIPIYFIYMDADPQSIDINIHPTKTEIKFEDERSVWHILNATIRESLGKFNFVPSIDFDTDGVVDIPTPKNDEDYNEPIIPVNPDYNPFNQGNSGSHQNRDTQNVKGWEQLYSGFETETFSSKMFQQDEEGNEDITGPAQQTILTSLDDKSSTSGSRFFQLKNRYILTSVKSGLMLIDQKRAHERILFEQFLERMNTHHSTSQKILFKDTLSFKPEDAVILNELKNELQSVGIEIDNVENGIFVVEALPSDLESVDARSMLESIIENSKNSEYNAIMKTNERIAFTLARKAAIGYNKPLDNMEMQELFDQLFACAAPNYSPDGKLIITILENDELESRFQ